MKNDISYDDLCNLIANEEGNMVSIATVDRYLRALYKVILKQLELNHRINIKGFGIFEIKERKSGERLINNPKNNKKQIYYVEPKYSISFRASSNFDYYVNENNFKLADRRKNISKFDRPSKKQRTKNVADLLNIANKRKKRKG